MDAYLRRRHHGCRGHCHGAGGTKSKLRRAEIELIERAKEVGLVEHEDSIVASGGEERELRKAFLGFMDAPRTLVLRGGREVLRRICLESLKLSVSTA